jgi:hypothetical protein
MNSKTKNLESEFSLYKSNIMLNDLKSFEIFSIEKDLNTISFKD